MDTAIFQAGKKKKAKKRSNSHASDPRHSVNLGVVTDGAAGSHNPLHHLGDGDHPPDMDGDFSAPPQFASAATHNAPAPTVTGFGDYDDEDLSSSLQTASR